MKNWNISLNWLFPEIVVFSSTSLTSFWPSFKKCVEFFFNLIGMFYNSVSWFEQIIVKICWNKNNVNCVIFFIGKVINFDGFADLSFISWVIFPSFLFYKSKRRRESDYNNQMKYYFFFFKINIEIMIHFYKLIYKFFLHLTKVR